MNKSNQTHVGTGERVGEIGRINQIIDVSARSLLHDVTRASAVVQWDDLSRQESLDIARRYRMAFEVAELMLGICSDSSKGDEIAVGDPSKQIDSAPAEQEAVVVGALNHVVANDELESDTTSAEQLAEITTDSVKTEDRQPTTGYNAQRRAKYDHEILELGSRLRAFFAGKEGQWISSSVVKSGSGLPKMNSTKFSDVVKASGISHNGKTAHGSAYGLFGDPSGSSALPNIVKKSPSDEFEANLNTYFHARIGEWVSALDVRLAGVWPDMSRSSSYEMFKYTAHKIGLVHNGRGGAQSAYMMPADISAQSDAENVDVVSDPVDEQATFLA